MFKLPKITSWSQEELQAAALDLLRPEGGGFGQAQPLKPAQPPSLGNLVLVFLNTLMMIDVTTVLPWL